MACKQCNTELECVEGKQAKVFCSDACRKKYARQPRTKPTPDTPEQPTPDMDLLKPGDDGYVGCCYEDADGVWKVRPPEDIPLADMTRRQLKAAQDRCQDWVNSPPHKELLRRLHSYSLARLKREGYWIPAWKATA